MATAAPDQPMAPDRPMQTRPAVGAFVAGIMMLALVALLAVDALPEQKRAVDATRHGFESMPSLNGLYAPVSVPRPMLALVLGVRETLPPSARLGYFGAPGMDQCVRLPGLKFGGGLYIWTMWAVQPRRFTCPSTRNRYWLFNGRTLADTPPPPGARVVFQSSPKTLLIDTQPDSP